MRLVTQELPEFLSRELMPDFNPKTIYHYTTINVLPEFMKDDGDLYCTHCRALNDDEEYRLGLEYARNFISRNYKARSRAMLGFVDRFYRLYRDKWRQPWIMSFTTEKDSLVQWVSYSDKRDGGYAIGFDYSRLRKLVAEKMYSCVDSFNIYLLPCLYLRHSRGNKTVEQDDQANGLLSFLLDQFANEFQDFVNNKETKSRGLIESIILLFASMIKNASFKHECECRLVIQPTDRASALENYRVVGTRPRLPSLMFPKLGKLRDLITEIGISPHGKDNVLRTAVELYAAKNDNSFSVYKSTSPYNGL